jgi:hypothetical protein
VQPNSALTRITWQADKKIPGAMPMRRRALIIAAVLLTGFGGAS